MNNVKVSIIIPVYNVERYVDQCIQSCLAQTMKEIEIICIDDASPDQCGKKIDEYAEKYPQLIIPIHLKQNLRQGGARNVGIKIAKGEYLCFVDGDDYIASDMCEGLYEIAVKGDRDIVCCDGYSVKNGEFSYLAVHNDEDCRNMASILHFTTQCYMIIRKKLITGYEVYYPEHVFHEDTAVVPIWFLLSASREYVHKAYYYAVRHDDSSSHSEEFSDRLQIVSVLKVLLENARRTGVYEKYKAQLDCFIVVRTECLIDVWEKNGYVFNSMEEGILQKEAEWWKDYIFDDRLISRLFTKGEYERQKYFLQYGRIRAWTEEEDYYFDSQGELRDYISMLRTAGYELVIWGYGMYGKRIDLTLQKITGDYWIGDKDPKLKDTLSRSGKVILDKEGIFTHTSNPFFLIASKQYYEEMLQELSVEKSRTLNIIQAIEKGKFYED